MQALAKILQFNLYLDSNIKDRIVDCLKSLVTNVNYLYDLFSSDTGELNKIKIK